MTNKEALIMALNDEFDDGGASYESWIHYHIKCPYRAGNPKALCFGELTPQRKLCFDCKEKWLESELPQ